MTVVRKGRRFKRQHTGSLPYVWVKIIAHGHGGTPPGLVEGELVQGRIVPSGKLVVRVHGEYVNVNPSNFVVEETGS